MVPLLLVVLVVVAEVRPADPCRERATATAISTSACARSPRSRRSSAPSFAATRSPSRCPRPKRCSTAFRNAAREWDGRGGAMHRLREFARTLAARRPSRRRSGWPLSSRSSTRRCCRFSTGANRRVSDARRVRRRALVRRGARHAADAGRDRPSIPAASSACNAADIAGAVATLARADGRMLAALAWRGTDVDRVMARWRPEQYVEISARQVARGNPVGRLAGCVYLGFAAPGADAASPEYFVAGTRSAAARLCNQPAMMGVAATDRPAASPASGAVGIGENRRRTCRPTTRAGTSRRRSP